MRGGGGQGALPLSVARKKKKMAGAQAEAFLAEYAGFLRDHKRNERSAISLLSMLAADNKQLAGGIVSTLERHILTVRCV